MIGASDKGRRPGRVLVFEKTLNHSIERVWQALTTAEELAQWLMPNDLVAKVGHAFTFRTKPAPGFDGVVHCEVVEVEPCERLSFTWVGGGIDTLVTFELRSEGATTHLKLTHEGFSGVRGRLVSVVLGRGWKKIVKRGVERYLAGQDGA